jgi:hypothetical protein
MANKKTKKAAELKEVARLDLGNGSILVKYEDGSYAIITTVAISAEQASEFFGSSEDDDDDEDDDDEDDDDEDDDDEDDDEEVTPESLAEMDFEELEDLCDDKELETSPDDYDEKDIEKLRAAIAKELGIKLPKKAAPAKGKKGKK